MNLTAAALRLMADKGLSGADIADIAEAMAAAPTSGAERQRRYRERKAAEHNASDVTGDVTPLHNERDADPSPQSPPLKSPPDPQKITPPLTPQPVVVGGRAKTKFDPPEGVTAEQFKAFRQQRKKPLNDRSYTLLCNKLATLAEAGWPPGEMIDLAVERGWETVFEPKDRAPRNGNSVRRIGTDPLLADYRRAVEEERAGLDNETDPGAWPPVSSAGFGSA